MALVKNLPASEECKTRGFNPWVWKIPWRRKWQLAPVFLSGESHGQSLVGYSPRSCKKVNTTEHACTSFVGDTSDKKRRLLLNRAAGSAGKEPACNAGNPGSIPGSGRSPGEGIGCPLQYSSASLVAQLVKNLPAMQETWVRFLGWEDPQEKGKATHSSILAWRIPWTL